MKHIGRKIAGIIAIGLAAIICVYYFGCGKKAQPTTYGIVYEAEPTKQEKVQIKHITGSVIDLKTEGEKLLYRGPSTEANYEIFLLKVKSDNNAYNLVSGKYKMDIKKGDKVDIDYIVDNEVSSVDILNRDGGFEIDPDESKSLEGVVLFSYKADGQIKEYKVINREK